MSIVLVPDPRPCPDPARPDMQSKCFHVVQNGLDIQHPVQRRRRSEYVSKRQWNGPRRLRTIQRLDVGNGQRPRLSRSRRFETSPSCISSKAKTLWSGQRWPFVRRCIASPSRPDRPDLCRPAGRFGNEHRHVTNLIEALGMGVNGRQPYNHTLFYHLVIRTPPEL